MRAVSDKMIVATDDGSYGKHGFVTDMLRELIEAGNQYDIVIAIGPIPMMKAVCALTKPYGIKTMVSLNPIMVDGTGMCGCCRVTVDGKIRFACVDGPDFDGHLVDFEELMHRNRFYKKQEEIAKIMSASCLEVLRMPNMSPKKHRCRYRNRKFAIKILMRLRLDIRRKWQ